MSKPKASPATESQDSTSTTEISKKDSVQGSSLSPKAGKILPAVVRPSAELAERIAAVDDNLATVENFRLPRMKMTSHGVQVVAEQDPVEVLENVVILHAKKTNVYYSKPYNPSNPTEPPTCFSLDGITPDANLRDKNGVAVTPQHATCKGCTKAEFGTNLMGKGKACRNLKPLFLLTSDQALIPRQLTISPTSLKAANQYLSDLTEMGLNYRKVLTHIEFYKKNTADTFMLAKFKQTGKVPAERQNDIDYLRYKWLPTMNNQNIDQSELGDTEQTAQAPIDTKGEF